MNIGSTSRTHDQASSLTTLHAFFAARMRPELALELGLHLQLPNESNLSEKPCDAAGDEAGSDGDLFNEHAKGEHLSPELIARFEAEGIGRAALETAQTGERQTVRVDKIVVCSAGRFEFARYSEFEDEIVSALTVVAYDQFGAAVDIVALTDGGDLLTLTGRVSMLGEEQALAPRLSRGLRVHPNMFSWLRGGRRGIVIIDPVRARGLLRHCGPLIAEDQDHRRQLLRDLTTPAPTILIADVGGE